MIGISFSRVDSWPNIDRLRVKPMFTKYYVTYSGWHVITVDAVRRAKATDVPITDRQRAFILIDK